MYSQLGQDDYVIKYLKGMKNGYFVEIGATDGINISNTLFLEEEYGWCGICIEPNLSFYEQLKNNRKCITDPSLLFSKEGVEVDFCQCGALSGIVELFQDHDGERDPARKNGKILKLRTNTLDNILKKYNSPQHINYISIDTEGSELEILKGIDFNRYLVDIISVEHNQTLRNDRYLYDIMKYLNNINYFFQILEHDVMCVHRSVLYV